MADQDPHYNRYTGFDEYGRIINDPANDALRPPTNPHGDFYYVPIEQGSNTADPMVNAANAGEQPANGDVINVAQVNPILRAPSIFMGQSTYALDAGHARFGFGSPDEDVPDRHNLIWAPLEGTNQTRSIGISNLRSFTDTQLRDLVNIFGSASSGYARLVVDPMKFGDIAWMSFASAEDADIAVAVLSTAKVLRKKTKEEKKAEAQKKQSPETNGVNGHTGQSGEGEDGTKSSDASAEYDSLVIRVDDITREYLEHWNSNPDTCMRPEERDAAINGLLKDIGGKLTSISEYNHQWNTIPYADDSRDETKLDDTNTLDAGELARMQDSYDDNAGGDDEDKQVTPEQMARVKEEIAHFRNKSVLLDKERLRREEERRKMRDEALEADRDGLPTGPKAERLAHKPNKPAEADQHWYLTRNNVWIDNYIFEVFDEDREQGLTSEQCIAKRRAEREQQRGDEFQKLLKQFENRQERKIAAYQRAEARARHEEERKRADREERIEFEENYDEERYKRESRHLYFRDRTTWERQARAERAEREAWEEVDRRAEAEEQAQAEGARRRNEGLADAFLNEQADAISAQQGSGFKLSLGAAAAHRQQQRDRRNNAVAEKLLAADDEDEVKPARRPLPTFAEDPDGTGLSEEEKRAGEEKLALEIKEAESDGRLYSWPIRWNILTAPFLKTRLRPWFEDQSVKYFAVVDDDFVNALEGKLLARAPVKEIETMLEELLDEETKEFVTSLWKMIVFVTEQAGRGLA